MVRVPVLDELPELAETEYPAVPLPLPLPLEVIVIQLVPLAAGLEALQGQPAEVVTLTVPVPPPEPRDWLAGEME